MAKIPYAEEGQAATGAAPVYEQIKQGMGTLLDIYFNKLSIDTKLREIAYLTAVRYNGCAYCQGHHVPMGKQAGLNDAQLEQLGEAGFDSEDFTPAERAVIRFAYETSRDVAASDAAIDALKQHFDNEQIVEIAFTVSSANFIQRIGKNLGVELES